jgi:Cdc6-like AAA superfamily ATPase
MSFFSSIIEWVARLLGWPARATVEEEPEYFPRPSVEPAARDDETGESPRFMANAGDQTALSGAFAAIRARLRTAYTPAQPVTDRKMYAGRNRVLATVIQAIEDQRLHAVIYGERGLGKTSTLHVLAQTASDARYRVVYITCSADSAFDEIFRVIAASIPLMFHADFGPTSPKAEAGDTFAALLGPEPVNTRLGGEILGKVVGTRVLVILDEFDRAVSEEYRRNIAELIKGLSDRAARVQLLIGGVAGNLSELIANVPSIQRNIFALQLPKMTPQEINDLIRNGEGVSGVTFADAAIDEIVAKALGFPYLATLLSHRSAMVAVDRGRMVVAAEDIDIATREVVEEFRGRVSRRSLAHVDDLAADGMLPVLGAIAGAAQTVGGWFVPRDVEAQHASAATIAEVGRFTETLANRHVLLETRAEGPGLAYHFIEESVPPYVWLAAGLSEQAEPEREPLT